MQAVDKRVLRAAIARKYLKGDGVEIGALATPLSLPASARVHYVDRMSRDELYREYPEMKGREVVEIDYVDDGETLGCLPDASVDFIVANHFLEHCQDLLGTLKTHFGKLLPEGALFYAVPNRLHTFDRGRPNTPFDHLVQDHVAGPEQSRTLHFAEWARLVERVPEAQVADRARALEEHDYSIHFHTWDAQALLHCITSSIDYLKLPAHVAHFELNGHESICVITRN
jgi:predicted SAM-dependent methyltransferase